MYIYLSILRFTTMFILLQIMKEKSYYKIISILWQKCEKDLEGGPERPVFFTGRVCCKRPGCFLCEKHFLEEFPTRPLKNNIFGVAG